MTQKDRSASKIATTPTNPNRKKKIDPSGPMAAGSSLLKKHEFTLIIAGALAVTLVVFFLFFSSSDSDTQTVSSSSQNAATGALEDRLASMEAALESMQAKLTTNGGDTTLTSMDATLVKLQQQVSRLEAAAQIKFDSLTERMGNLEQKLSTVSKMAASPAPVKSAETTPSVKKAPNVQDKKTAEVFHTVKKGETLWRIAQKYNTTVAALRKLNNLDADDDIYPGTNILVR
ncbi:MAG: LysM peptidoglycan-binding domain-containing protein [Desulfotignum sp.]|nr:LysM peptidoglycan-binding domain-containing protein [Desulfobacteraceae bacterium]